MCYMLYLGSTRPLPTTEDDRQYPELAVVSIEDAGGSRFGNTAGSLPRSNLDLLSSIRFVYDVAPAGLCGCYFEHPDRGELEDELEATSDGEARSWVSNVAYPDLDPREGARRWWERKHTAVTSLGRYLSDHVQDGPLLLYVVWGSGDQLPPLEQQLITPSYFAQAKSLALSEHMLFTIVAEPTHAS